MYHLLICQFSIVECEYVALLFGYKGAGCLTLGFASTPHPHLLVLDLYCLEWIIHMVYRI